MYREYEVSLITPTHNRPKALSLCLRWMNGQDFNGSIRWFIVDDGVNSMPANFKCDSRFDLVYLRRVAHKNEKGPKSLAANLLYAFSFDEVMPHKIIMIEDDDYYAPNHISDMVRRLNKVDMAGTIWQKYYNVAKKRYIVQKNVGSAMFSTGFRKRLIPEMVGAAAEAYQKNLKGIDRIFWDSTKKYKRDLYDENKVTTCIGIKGLPGCKGIGHGHRPEKSQFKYKHDSTGRVLKAWVGEEVGSMYLRRFCNV